MAIWHSGGEKTTHHHITDRDHLTKSTKNFIEQLNMDSTCHIQATMI